MKTEYPNLQWEGYHLKVSGETLAEIAFTEGKRGVYGVWCELPGGEELEGIKGLKVARRHAERVVQEWFDKMLNS